MYEPLDLMLKTLLHALARRNQNIFRIVSIKCVARDFQPMDQRNESEGNNKDLHGKIFIIYFTIILE